MDIDSRRQHQNTVAASWHYFCPRIGKASPHLNGSIYYCPPPFKNVTFKEMPHWPWIYPLCQSKMFQILHHRLWISTFSAVLPKKNIRAQQLRIKYNIIFKLRYNFHIGFALSFLSHQFLVHTIYVSGLPFSTFLHRLSLFHCSEHEAADELYQLATSDIERGLCRNNLCSSGGPSVYTLRYWLNMSRHLAF